MALPDLSAFLSSGKTAWNTCMELKPTLHRLSAAYDAVHAAAEGVQTEFLDLPTLPEARDFSDFVTALHDVVQLEEEVIKHTGQHASAASASKTLAIPIDTLSRVVETHFAKFGAAVPGGSTAAEVPAEKRAEINEQRMRAVTDAMHTRQQRAAVRELLEFVQRNTDTMRGVQRGVAPQRQLEVTAEAEKKLAALHRCIWENAMALVAGRLAASGAA